MRDAGWRFSKGSEDHSSHFLLTIRGREKKENEMKMKNGSFFHIVILRYFSSCGLYTFNHIQLADEIKVLLPWPHANYSC